MDNPSRTRAPIRSEAPPSEWGVLVERAAIRALARQWAAEPFPMPGWDYAGLPRGLPVTGWFDFCGMAVSVLACLWPPAGEDVWSVEYGGLPLSDAPALFACFSRSMKEGAAGLDARRFERWTDRDAESFFAGSGVLQLIGARGRILQQVARILAEKWDGHFANLVEDAGFSAPAVVERLVSTFPSYRDEWPSERGVLPFNKLAHLSAAMMAAGGGVDFTGLDSFPVYPDYMLPVALRHYGILHYAPDLAAAVDRRELIPPGSRWELAIRWATVYAGDRLAAALHDLGNPVITPALDYHLWYRAVLGPEAGTMGEHHRTVTMGY